MRNIKFDFQGEVASAEMVKLDRSKLYGSVDVEAVDPDGNECRTVSLASDGRTLIGKGGAGLGVLSVDGQWVSRKDLAPVTSDGVKITPVESSFAAPVTLNATNLTDAEELLNHRIRSTYQLVNLSPHLLGELQDGDAIFKFDYSYRGGIQYDVAFILANSAGDVFMLVGSPCELEMIGLAEEVVVDEEEIEEEEEDDDLDFGMM